MIHFDKLPFGIESKILRPVPFISISSSPLRAGTMTLGNEYTITLNGTILPHRGSPFTETVASGAAINPRPIPLQGNGNFAASMSDVVDNANDKAIANDSRGAAIIIKQNAIRELFSYDGMNINISSWNGTPIMKAPVTLESLTFAEGNYVNTSTYTAVFKAPYLLNDKGELFTDSSIALIRECVKPSGDENFISYLNNNGQTVETARKLHGGFVTDFNDDWSIEVDDQLGETSDTDPFQYNPRTYIVTRNASATGKVTWEESQNGPNSKIEAWENARNFLIKALKPTGVPASILENTQVELYPDYATAGSDEQGGQKHFAHGLIDINTAGTGTNASGSYNGYDHYRTENINKSTGTVSITDRWVLLKSSAHENYNVSIDSSNTDPFVSFSIQGSIKGVTKRKANDVFFGGNKVPDPASPENTRIADENAMKKYNIVTNNGKFDINSFIYKRVSAITNLDINPQPLSISVSRNPFAGEITYSLQYNNRPLNIVSEASSEVINISDTYPGDLYAIIPVIGRPAGPVLQYIGGRTEYQRSVNIELLFDYTDIDRYAPPTLTVANKADEILNTRKSLLLSKPTLINGVRDQINNLVRSVSPLNEPGIRKCFVNPPRENWSPREGRYSLSIDWVYELDPEVKPDSQTPTDETTVVPE